MQTRAQRVSSSRVKVLLKLALPMSIVGEPASMAPRQFESREDYLSPPGRGTINVMKHRIVLVLLTWMFTSSVQAGLHYSGEQMAVLPSQWRGYLVDQRSLRMIGVAPRNVAPTYLREQYEEAAAKLTKTAQQRRLTADEAADLGALHVRLGETGKAIEVLRAAQRLEPEHFRIAANLGTAWQAQGDLEEAARQLREAVKFAPPAWKEAESLHLKLVQSRLREGKNASTYDDLFGIAYDGESGKPEAGKLAPAEKKKLPANAAALVQQLGLWLPADGRLLGQLGEIANAHGDVRTAAAILDGCITEFALASPDIRRRRQIYREASDVIDALPDREHEKYRGDLQTKSPRPLLRALDPAFLPAIRPEGVNVLPWIVVAETSIGRGFKPRFNPYLEDLDGKRVAITGFMYPTGTEMTDLGSFMLVEYPIGCWFCETPDPTGIIFVTLAKDKSTPLKKGIVKIAGTLKLNRTDPEQYIYTIRNAQIGEPD